MRKTLGAEGPSLNRLMVAALFGVVVSLLALALPGRLPLTMHLLMGWVATALWFLAQTWLHIRRADARHTRAWATRDDDSRAVSGLLILVASLASLVGTGFALSDSQDLQQQGHTALGLTLTGLALLSVVVSWFLIHTEYTLHYARLYYMEPVGGIDFPRDNQDPEGQDPHYRDFAYLAFTVGMTYQVSDTDITQRRIRRRLLGHALLSFLYGTVIVAFTINVVAGLIK